MAFTLHVQNLRALRNVEWSPEGVCALVGPNGAGKSTLLLALKFLHLSAQRGVDEGFRRTFGGSYGLRNRLAPEHAAISIGLDVEELRWEIRLEPRGASILWPAQEKLVSKKSDHDESLERAAGEARVTTVRSPPLGKGSITWLIGSTADLAIQQLALANSEYRSPDAQRVLDCLTRARVFHDPDLWSLRTNGSSTIADSTLESRGRNAFAVLHMWNSRREHRDRHRFVVGGLQAAFPSSCHDLDFETAGQTVFARIWAPGAERATPIANEANGLLAMLVYLCDIASGEQDGLVAIDEPENSLHPFALRELVRAAEAWSARYATTIVFATHSPVILDALDGQPERVWVMRNDAGEDVNPTRLTELKNPEWLSHFALGALYVNGELGSNEDAA